MKLATEMALDLPTTNALNFFKTVIEPKDYLPTPVYMGQTNVQREAQALDTKSYRMIQKYGTIYDRIIYYLSLYWDNRGDVDTLCNTILNNPARGDRAPKPGKNPFDPTVPENIRIAESLQGLRNWIDYYNSPLWAVWRPELKRIINDIAIIANKRKVRPYRATTARSKLQALNPIRTMVAEIIKELIKDNAGNALQEIFKVTTVITISGGLEKKIFVDFYDTMEEARRSDLFKDAKALSVPDYISKYADNEIVDNYES